MIWMIFDLCGWFQGPFRDPADVQNQRYKEFQPSLRVATSFTSLEEARQRMKDEEWVTRLNDNVYVQLRTTIINDNVYISLMMNQT